MLRPALAIVSAVLLSAGSGEANKVFVRTTRGNNITVLDSESWEVIATFRPETGRADHISPDGKELYVARRMTTPSGSSIPRPIGNCTPLPSGPDPEIFASILPAIRSNIANEDDNLVTVVDVKTRQVLAEVPVGGRAGRRRGQPGCQDDHQ